MGRFKAWAERRRDDAQGDFRGEKKAGFLSCMAHKSVSIARSMAHKSVTGTCIMMQKSV